MHWRCAYALKILHCFLSFQGGTLKNRPDLAINQHPVVICMSVCLIPWVKNLFMCAWLEKIETTRPCACHTIDVMLALMSFIVRGALTAVSCMHHGISWVALRPCALVATAWLGSWRSHLYPFYSSSSSVFIKKLYRRTCIVSHSIPHANLRKVKGVIILELPFY